MFIFIFTPTTVGYQQIWMQKRAKLKKAYVSYRADIKYKMHEIWFSNIQTDWQATIRNQSIKMYTAR